MIAYIYTYPGDPPATVTLMFGAEFVKANPNRYIAISAVGDDVATYIPVVDVICDTCNAAILGPDPCAESVGRLQCWPCFLEWVRPYIKVDQ